jgi:hypothetical protein
MQSAKNKIDKYRQSWINHLDRLMAKNKSFCIINQRIGGIKEKFGKDGMSM